MMELELISVVIPAYNVAPYIERCVESVLDQTYQNVEIIIVDDGSKDGTGEIIDRIALKEPRVRVIHQPNSGVTEARMTGVEAANGEWIGFVDGDDLVERDMYERLISVWREAGVQVETGRFRAEMQVSLVNDGPVTILLDSEKNF